MKDSDPVSRRLGNDALDWMPRLHVNPCRVPTTSSYAKAWTLSIIFKIYRTTSKLLGYLLFILSILQSIYCVQ